MERSGGPILSKLKSKVVKLDENLWFIFYLPKLEAKEILFGKRIIGSI